MFDCDGLIVDSAACWERAYERIAQRSDRDLAAVDLDSLAGASVAIAAGSLSRSLGVAVTESDLRRALFDSFAAFSPVALPGATAIIDSLSACMPLAVASNAPREIVVDILGRLGVLDAFQTVVSAEETTAHKPAPDVYVEACRQLAVSPLDAIAFEDSALGARAARAAGLLVIAVPATPQTRIEADLRIPRLDDPRLVRYLDLD